ncbi:hypothetical protein CASFOL_002605 [Castilleja foliolosa]|uniref:[Histone H3]-lysine(27) N-trimethyltransferase n=1 Tax=Castilleja foliolosa TaxID=1961234 RepID=A0ABD3EIQ4_9LAMI
MVSKPKIRRLHEELGSDDAMSNLSFKLTQLKRQIYSERVVSVGEKLDENRKKAQAYHSHLREVAASRTHCAIPEGNSNSNNILSLRMSYPLFKVNGLFQRSTDPDDASSAEVVFSSTVKFPIVERIPTYTTWIFLDRNQRMADDQSIVGRRRIYYDPHGSEALICSDSEEELGQLEGEKHEFSNIEDRFMRVAVQEYGVANEVIDKLTQFVGGTSQEIQERCNILMENDQPIEKNNIRSSREERYVDNVFLEKGVAAALDSFDNLFCRRCLVFDCRLHGCTQNLAYPNEKQSYPFDPEDDREPCGDQCYLELNDLKELTKNPALDPLNEGKASGNEGYLSPPHAIEQAHPDSLAKASELDLDDFQSSSSKKLKLSNPNPLDDSPGLENKLPELCEPHDYEPERDSVQDKGKDITELPLKQACNPTSKSVKDSYGWRPFERELYLKGLEIFGRNSCCIARNLLPGLKTCKEVYTYMYADGSVISRGSSAILSSCFEDFGKAYMDYMELDRPGKSRICRKRGRVRKVKSSWKSAGHPSLWRRIADGKDQPCKQYTPCGCQPVCGKECPCLQNGTCCEKYCGCSKSCKNLFRGCHCAKSQCKSRQCPCFAGGRECDPDVCRNCWVSCGDGSFGEPPRRGDSQCGNMKLLLRQQQRIILAKSDVAGWGAFLKNSVNKNDYLGEYTGELISHQEADKRGKIYDRANSSFLFDLNDEYVLDAYRKGDKLKFANHSATPNCYAKVMLVAGDHRVGIYANERIDSGEEIFYDYRYGPEQAPSWARKPESSKRDDSQVPHQGRAKKHQSG